MNPLKSEALNAVIAGGGGIGSAFVETLLAEYPVERLFLLQRSERAVVDDPRCVTIPIDATDPDSIARAGAQVSEQVDAVQLVINAVGMLHDDQFKPEKRLKDVSLEALVHLSTINAFFLPQLAMALSPLLRHSAPSVLASLSARVGSITDNGMGGWYSYRASKAAHNMLLRTLAREWRISHKHCSLVALHPGTVQTGLSEPYTPPNYKKRVLSPQESARALLAVIETVGAEQSGRFFAWNGEEIPW